MSLNCLDSTPAWLIEDLNKIFKSQQNAENNVVGVRQKIHAKRVAHGRKSLNGLGQPYLSVDTHAYHYWGQRLGYECWKDNQFLREFHRDNEACRVKSGGTKEIMVGYGSKSDGAAKRFTKSYA